MFLVETWLNSTTGVSTLMEACPPNSHVYQSVRLNRRGGGSAAIVSTHFVCDDIHLGEFTCFEYLALELKAELSVLIITLYQPPRYSSLFLQELSELISLGITRYERLILNRDLNIHINKKNDSKAVELVNLLDSFGLMYM